MAKQYWIRVGGGKTYGPVSGKQLKQLAEIRKLRPTHEISEDQNKWTVAGRVNGLPFSRDNTTFEKSTTPHTAGAEGHSTPQTSEIATFSKSNQSSTFSAREASTNKNFTFEVTSDILRLQPGHGEEGQLELSRAMVRLRDYKIVVDDSSAKRKRVFYPTAFSSDGKTDLREVEAKVALLWAWQQNLTQQQTNSLCQSVIGKENSVTGDADAAQVWLKYHKNVQDFNPITKAIGWSVVAFILLPVGLLFTAYGGEVGYRALGLLATLKGGFALFKVYQSFEE